MYTKYARVRDEKGLTDNKVAELIGLTPSTIYDWKQRSEKNPAAKLSVDNLAKIAKLFEVPIETFLED